MRGPHRRYTGLADRGGVRITKGIDQFLRALATAPLGESLAGEPGQNEWPHIDVRTALASEDDDATGASAPEATAVESAGPPTAGLDAHEVARLEATHDLVESLGLGFHLGGAVERIGRGASEGQSGVKTLREASWLIDRYIALIEQRPVGADLHAESMRVDRAGEAIAELRAISAALETERAPDSSVPVDHEAVASEPAPAPEVAPEKQSFGHEVALMAVRWSIMVASVIAVVLALTLIGEWL